jgi:hypothetical protein
LSLFKEYLSDGLRIASLFINIIKNYINPSPISIFKL